MKKPQSIADVAADLRAGKTSSVELTRAALARIAAAAPEQRTEPAPPAPAEATAAERAAPEPGAPRDTSQRAHQ